MDTLRVHASVSPLAALTGSLSVAGDAPFLPPETPLAMVSHGLGDPEASQRRAQFKPMPTLLRRAYILLGTAALSAASGYEMFEVLQVGGVTILEGIVLGLFVLLFAWVAFSFMLAMAGFALLLVRGRDPLGIEPLTPLPAICGRD